MKLFKRKQTMKYIATKIEEGKPWGSGKVVYKGYNLTKVCKEADKKVGRDNYIIDYELDPNITCIYADAEIL